MQPQISTVYAATNKHSICNHKWALYMQPQINTLYAATNKHCICNHKHTLLAQVITTSNRFYCITKQRSKSILIFFNLIILWNCNFNSFNFKNSCNLARHKCKTPEGWYTDVETRRSIQYIKRYCCDIYLCIGWLK